MKKYKTTPEKLAVLKTRGNYYRNWEKYQDDEQFAAEGILIRLCREWNYFLHSTGEERDLDGMMSWFELYSMSERITDSRDFFEMMRELGKLNSYARLWKELNAYHKGYITCPSKDEEDDYKKFEKFMFLGYNGYYCMGEYLKWAKFDNLYNKLSVKTQFGRYAKKILLDTSSHLMHLDGMIREWVKKQTKAVKNAKAA